MTARPKLPSSGDVLGSFTLSSVLSEAAHGTVFEAERTSDGLRVALTVLAPAIVAEAPKAAERFADAAEKAAKLEHEHLVPIHESGQTDDGVPWMATDLISGRPLAEDLGDGEFDPERAKNIGHQVASALAVLHANDIVQAGLSPSSIIVTDTDDDSDFVKILCFGTESILRTTADGRAATELSLGSARYAAPEQLGDVAGPRSDVYAVGLVLLEMLTGKPSVDADTVDEAKKQLLNQKIKMPGWLARSPFGPILARSLQKEAARRYPSGAKLADALERVDPDKVEKKTKKTKSKDKKASTTTSKAKAASASSQLGQKSGEPSSKEKRGASKPDRPKAAKSSSISDLRAKLLGAKKKMKKASAKSTAGDTGTVDTDGDSGDETPATDEPDRADLQSKPSETPPPAPSAGPQAAESTAETSDDGEEGLDLDGIDTEAPEEEGDPTVVVPDDHIQSVLESVGGRDALREAVENERKLAADDTVADEAADELEESSDVPDPESTAVTDLSELVKQSGSHSTIERDAPPGPAAAGEAAAQPATGEAAQASAGEAAQASAGGEAVGDLRLPDASPQDDAVDVKRLDVATPASPVAATSDIPAPGVTPVKPSPPESDDDVEPFAPSQSGGNRAMLYAAAGVLVLGIILILVFVLPGGDDETDDATAEGAAEEVDDGAGEENASSESASTEVAGESSGEEGGWGNFEEPAEAETDGTGAVDESGALEAESAAGASDGFDFAEGPNAVEAPERVVWSLSSTPEGASVVDGSDEDVVLCPSTPCNVEFDIGEDPVEIAFVLDEYEQKLAKVKPVEAGELAVDLEKKKKKRKRRKKRRRKKKKKKKVDPFKAKSFD